MIKFTKMHGIGNDYVFINCLNKNNTIINPSELSKKISNRHFGIGSDGLILIKSSKKADFKMEIYNSDGSSALMCGNGIRCLAKYVYEKHLTNKTKISVDTRSGIKYINLIIKNKKVFLIKVNMGKPEIYKNIVDIKINNLKLLFFYYDIYRITKVSIGNKHIVFFFNKNIKKNKINKIIKYFKYNKIIDCNVNMEFIYILSNKIIKIRVFEKGSGETLACGTGACASVVAFIKNKYTNKNKIIANLLGGNLNINYNKDNVYMIGSATTVFDGAI